VVAAGLSLLLPLLVVTTAGAEQGRSAAEGLQGVESVEQGAAACGEQSPAPLGQERPPNGRALLLAAAAAAALAEAGETPSDKVRFCRWALGRGTAKLPLLPPLLLPAPPPLANGANWAAADAIPRAGEEARADAAAEAIARAEPGPPEGYAVRACSWAAAAAAAAACWC
jgi:hypothetical protein